MNTLYTITINRRKYVTTSFFRAYRFSFKWRGYISWDTSKTATETIPSVIAL